MAQALRQVALYVDGELAAQRACEGAINFQPSGIGTSSQRSIGRFEGAMDNLLIWDTARTRSQICQTAGIACE